MDDWRQRQECERTAGREQLIALLNQYHVDPRWDKDSAALVLGGWVTIYAPDSPDNESGQWEVWTDSVSRGVRYYADGSGEPDTVESDLHKAFLAGDQALCEALSLLIKARTDADD